MMQVPDTLAVPKDGDIPVFVEPWEARIFAMVVALHDQGRFEWKDFQSLLVAEIKTHENTGASQAYYQSWLNAAVVLFGNLGMTEETEILTEIQRLRPDDRTIVLSRRQ